MENTQIVLVTLIVYKVILIGIGILASRRTHSEADFFLGGRGLGPTVAAISASASSSSAWTLLGVSGFAYTQGLSAIWLFPACVGGFVINWVWIAPRLRRMSAEKNAITLTDLFTEGHNPKARATLASLASAIIVISLLFYVASQFVGAGKTFQSTFGLSAESSIIIGSIIIVFYTLIGGFWAVSLTDTFQGLVMAFTSLLIPLVALLAVGGPIALVEGLEKVEISGFSNVFGGLPLAAAIGFILGLLGIGLGYPGQPHVVNRFMAIKNERGVIVARRIALTWATVVYAGMILLGWCGRILFPTIADNETIFFAVTGELFHPILAGVMIAAVLSAVMSTADSQLLVAGSSISHDLPFFKKGKSLSASRIVVLVLSAAAVLLAWGPQEIFSRVLFAWNAMGAAFGPLLVVILWKGPVGFKATFAAISVGFATAVLAYLIPEFQGTWRERILPYLLAGIIAYLGSVSLSAGKSQRK